MADIQRVLIPTDFSVDSLRIALEYLERTSDKQVELVLTGGYYMDDSITGLLGFTKEYYLDEIQNEDFIKGCGLIKSRFGSRIVEIYTDLFLSKNSRYVKNYIKGARITQIVHSEGYNFQFPNRNFFDVSDLLNRSNNEIISRINVIINDNLAENIDALDGIFFRKDWRVGYE